MSQDQTPGFVRWNPEKLQDYQMQLRMLEQQRIQRESMMRVREEQEALMVREPSNPMAGTTSVQNGSAPSVMPASFAPNARERYDKKRKHSDDPNMRRVAVASSSILIPDEEVQSVPVSLAVNEVVRDIELPVDLNQRLAILEEENHALKAKLSGQRKAKYLVLHKIQRDNTVSLEVPKWTVNHEGRPELKAEMLLSNPDLYLQSQSEIVFVVEKYYSASTTSNAGRKNVQPFDTTSPPRPVKESVRLISDEMKAAFQSFVNTKPNFGEHFPEVVVQNPTAAPYIWYMYRSDPQLFDLLQPSHQELMKPFTSWIERNYKHQYADVDEQFINRRISYDLMDYFIRPGDVLISKGNGSCREIRAYLATSFLSRSDLERPQDSPPSADALLEGPHPHGTPWHWNVDCWSLGFNGKFSRVRTTLKLSLLAEHRSTLVAIEDLNVMPLRFASFEVRAQLAKRGSIFWSCRKRRLVSCETNEQNNTSKSEERYMIDFNAYMELHPDKQAKQTTASRRENQSEYLFTERMDEDGPPLGSELYLFPPTIVGYSLRRNSWHLHLPVDDITEVIWNKDAFDHLVAEGETKEIVQALAANRLTGRRNTDFIPGKGKGRIILLHGEPGTGKTFTVESVAEMTEMPLVCLTCGDIEAELKRDEMYLDSVLRLGKIWNCVVLLDRADVFLEGGSTTDMGRNALASLFFRVLEHYDGTVFLTSRRVGDFHQAFKSPVYLTLYYETLKHPQRSCIWKNFLNRFKSLKESDIDFDELNRYIPELSTYHMNGRQIRDSIMLARELAKAKGTLMSYMHLKHAIKVVDI